MTIDADLPRVGEVLRSKYELLRLLGEGGMSVVFEARRPEGDRVAVKVLAPEFAHEEELVARFDREARAVVQLQSPHIVKVLEVDVTESGLPFIVMDYLDGRDLCEELEERARIPLDEAIDYILQTCSGMNQAHRAGIVHRDLKPANLFLTNLAGPRVVKVLDFGISKLANDPAKLTGAGSIMGTFIYMSPEQIHSSTDVDQRADIWSLGVILFELLAGRAPFEGPDHTIALAIANDVAPDVRTFARDVPEAVALTIANMLRRDRDERFRNTRQIISALAPFVKPASVGAEIAASFSAKSTLTLASASVAAPSTRNPSAGMTLPLNSMQVTMPLGASYAGPKPPASNPASSPAPPPPSAPVVMDTPSPELDAIAIERRARAARTVESRRRSGVSLSVILAGAGLGVLAAAIVIGVVFLVASRGRSHPRHGTPPNVSARRLVATAPPRPTPLAPTTEPTSSASQRDTDAGAPPTAP